MKKITVLVFLVSGVFMANAMTPDDSIIHPKKANSEKPHRFSAAVPPCSEDMPAYLVALEQYKIQNSSNQPHSKNPLSESQELRRCP